MVRCLLVMVKVSGYYVEQASMFTLRLRGNAFVCV
jgi:hypothetical protein